MSNSIRLAGALSAVVLSMSAWATPPDGAVSQVAESDVGTAQQPMSFDLTFAPEGTVSNVDGAVTVSGTVFCFEPQYVNFYGQLTQKSGRDLVTGYFSRYNMPCNGLTPFTFTIIPSNGRFVSGRARLTATTYSYDPETGAYVEETEDVIIRLRNEPTRNP